MTKRLLLYSLGWLSAFLLCLLINMAGQRDIAMRKVRLLRREIVNREWEVRQARELKSEVDKLRWMNRATELRHAEWYQIIETIYRKANEYGLRPDLVLAIAHRESNFAPFAQSNFAAGILQINWSVWAETLGLDMKTIFDIENNVDAGCLILRLYLNETGGDEIRALELYNCGYRLSNPRYVPRVKSSRYYRGVK